MEYYTVGQSYYTSGSKTTPRVEYYNYRMTGGALIAGDRYVYDALGNITEIQESEPASGSSVRRTKVRYTYDDQNQLKTETHYTYSSNTDTTGTAVTSTYTYDTAGNMLSSSDGTNTLTYTYGDSSWNDLLTEINNQPIIYDACGNPTTYSNGEDSFLFSWTEGRRLTTLENPKFEGTVIYSYNYDSNGVRTAKVGKLDKHSYQTLNGKVVLETVTLPKRQKRVLHFIYDESGRPFALIHQTDGVGISLCTYYYVLNLQGDVVKLVTASGDVVANYEYDAWGNILLQSGEMASINPLRYRGYYYDTETGFYYLQSRYYDPANRRFINADTYASTGQGFVGTNMFAYCRNNPISRIDASGTRDEESEDDKSIWSTENDPQGLFILLHWLYGGGKDCDFVEGAWGDYMRNNKRLSGFIREIAYEQAASLSAGESQEIDITTSAEIENGESIIGYQYLHGTNADVGGFRVIGSVGKTTHG